MKSISHKTPSGGNLQTLSYTYDDNGNRLTQVDSTGTSAFGYDALNRLTSAVYPAGYGFWTWQYDPVGNRLVQTAPSGTTNYTYDANNRLMSAGSVTYTYDDNGNMKTMSSGQSFNWDVFNRMTSGTGSGGTATYTYNGDGLKIRRIGPEGTTRYFYDGIRPIWEADGANAMTAQLDRDIFGNLLSRKEPAGTTTALSDEGGATVATLLFDAWGNQRTASGASVPNYRFTGAELDSASGLYHMGARFYDPTIGRCNFTRKSESTRWIRDSWDNSVCKRDSRAKRYDWVNANTRNGHSSRDCLAHCLGLEYVELGAPVALITVTVGRS